MISFVNDCSNVPMCSDPAAMMPPLKENIQGAINHNVQVKK